MQLVGWLEQPLKDGEFAEHDDRALSTVIARLGAADVWAFGLTWEVCENLQRQFDYAPRVEVVAVWMHPPAQFSDRR